MNHDPLERSERDVLIRIEERQDRLISDLAEHLRIHCVFDRRLSIVEQRQWKWAGGLAVGVFVVTLLANLLMKTPQVRTTIVTPSAIAPVP